ncbi:MAG: hypothetical protein KF823_10610 [Xanthomonadales bacterium]|nr:hypothetical protein [Xanthomonadales bacterium]
MRAQPESSTTQEVAGRSVRGSVRLVAARGQSLAAGEIANAVAIFRPTTPFAAPRPGRFSIVTRGKRFLPTTLVVPVGSTVGFPNDDDVLHNAFSDSPGNRFDLGLYGEGESADVVLGSPGVVMVFCNVHYGMYAAIVVVDTPFAARVDAEGGFRFDNVPDGQGVLEVWHPRAGVQRLDIDAGSGRAAEVVLTIDRPLIPDHTRLDGSSYGPAR